MTVSFLISQLAGNKAVFNIRYRYPAGSGKSNPVSGWITKKVDLYGRIYGASLVKSTYFLLHFLAPGSGSGIQILNPGQIQIRIYNLK
jgi:hypothetical protein